MTRPQTRILLIGTPSRRGRTNRIDAQQIQRRTQTIAQSGANPSNSIRAMFQRYLA
ncbi:hypothetical protein BDD14_6317 [Edaphobacter modestus]|uniref:Uncharacterized protein n=1 Tax=Edaphobacter modestus TaxID=388466 RepID=A0A4Q7Y224_9BACT|nr:hypothetical protein BDD14_6317 [Edaphobacter modestus]